MIGAIIGDIVGSRFEFNPTNDYHFEFFTDECSYTDDTICTVAVADALLHNRRYGESIHAWCRRYLYPKGGYGGSFRQWVLCDEKEPKSYGSFGNGAAMRVSPIAMWFDDPDQIMAQAELSACCTHDHPEGIKGAKTTAWMGFAAVHGFDDAYTPEDMQKEIDHIVTVTLLENGYSPFTNYERFRNRFDETCQGTVPVALDIIRKSTGFEDAVRKAVSLGADADTLGAVVGGIAEHIWGIPPQMIGKALSYLPQEMKEVVRAFYQACESRPLYKPRKKEQEMNNRTAILFWKLALGDANKALNGEDPLPPKTRTATANDMQLTYLSDDPAKTLEIVVNSNILAKDVTILRQGHIPQVMEDHWFMYCDDEYIRYFRSWTGDCAFEARLIPNGRFYRIYKLRVNRSLEQFGIRSEDAAAMLFIYLISAETGSSTAAQAWNLFVTYWKRDQVLYV